MDRDVFYTEITGLPVWIMGPWSGSNWWKSSIGGDCGTTNQTKESTLDGDWLVMPAMVKTGLAAPDARNSLGKELRMGVWAWTEVGDWAGPRMMAPYVLGQLHTAGKSHSSLPKTPGKKKPSPPKRHCFNSHFHSQQCEEHLGWAGSELKSSLSLELGLGSFPLSVCGGRIRHMNNIEVEYKRNKGKMGPWCIFITYCVVWGPT